MQTGLPDGLGEGGLGVSVLEEVGAPSAPVWGPVIPREKPHTPQEASQRASEKSGSQWSWEGPLGTPLGLVLMQVTSGHATC